MMPEAFIELTRVDAEPRASSIFVNLANVAWIESAANGTSRIVFTVASPSAPVSGEPLSIAVRESAEEIALLAGVVRKTDRDAIAQAWMDQRGRRGMDNDQA
jgi:hypothetical protein